MRNRTVLAIYKLFLLVLLLGKLLFLGWLLNLVPLLYCACGDLLDNGLQLVVLLDEIREIFLGPVREELFEQV